MKIIFALSTLLLIGTSCAKKNPSSWLMNPPLEYELHEQSGEPPVYEFEPKAEIIFVVDNSASMNAHIQKVSANIDLFVDAFSKNNPLEYRLAVMSVYDSRTFLSTRYSEQFAETHAIPALGEFQPVKISETNIIEDKYFISSQDENIVDLLRNTLKVGIQELNQGGPQYEELFSPLAAIYSPNVEKSEPLQRQHAEFKFDPNSYKIIFFITDATDASSISASELHTLLVSASNGDANKVMAFGAMVPSDATDCKRDPGDKAHKLENFLDLTRQSSEGSNIISLCEAFGQPFADFGKSIRHRILSTSIKLKNGLPLINGNLEETLRVFYGEQEIPFQTHRDIIGYTYDPRDNSIQINPEFVFVEQVNAKVRIVYNEIDPRKARPSLVH